MITVGVECLFCTSIPYLNKVNVEIAMAHGQIGDTVFTKGDAQLTLEQK